MKNSKALSITAFIFIGCLGIGFWIACHRVLWNDEYYSLLRSTLGISYKSIFAGGISEGNNSPLFYILQKVQCDLFSYRLPHEWVAGHWSGVHVFDQLFLRVQSVIFMSVAVSTVFYYFSRRNSLLVGAYALAVAMTSSLFWFHWTEARPYADWFALSLFQILCLLNILEISIEQNKKSVACLTVVHWLLSLVSVISMVQIMAAGAVLLMFRRATLLWLMPLVLVPLGICCFYYVHAPHYSFYFTDGPGALINANIPKDRLFIIFLSAAIFVVQCRGKHCTTYLEMKYLVFFILMLLSFGLVLLKLKCGQVSAQNGSQVSNRYFLSLAPAGIVGVVLFSEYLMRAFPSRRWRVAIALILAGFLVFRFHKAAQQNDLKLNLSFHPIIFYHS